MGKFSNLQNFTAKFIQHHLIKLYGFYLHFQFHELPFKFSDELTENWICTKDSRNSSWSCMSMALDLTKFLYICRIFQATDIRRLQHLNAICSFLFPHFVFGFTDNNVQCCLLGCLGSDVSVIDMQRIIRPIYSLLLLLLKVLLNYIALV